MDVSTTTNTGYLRKVLNYFPWKYSLFSGSCHAPGPGLEVTGWPQVMFCGSLKELSSPYSHTVGNSPVEAQLVSQMFRGSPSSEGSLRS